MDIKDLKATAYDLLANIEYLQAKLREVNTQIGQLAQEQEKNGSDSSISD